MLGARLFKPQPIVLVTEDPAIDLDNSSVSKYLSTWDESNLKFYPGQEPTRFIIKQLTEAQKDFIDGFPSLRAKAKASIKFSLQGIEGYQVQGENGELLCPDLKHIEMGNGLGTALSDESLVGLHLSIKVLLALHMAIAAFSEAQLIPLE